MKQYPGYTLVKQEGCPEQHGTLTVLTHDVSGASVLLVEKTESGNYLGHTILTLPMAYLDARLLCRPSSDWLRPNLISTGESN